MASASLYRNSSHHARRSDGTSRLRWLAAVPGVGQSISDDEVIFSGALTPATEAFLSHHVVGGSILLPGVSFIEMAFAANPSPSSLTAIAYVRPCSLPGPTAAGQILGPGSCNLCTTTEALRHLPRTGCLPKRHIMPGRSRATRNVIFQQLCLCI